nr:unnamed protein product [Timema tahoe]
MTMARGRGWLSVSKTQASNQRPGGLVELNTKIENSGLLSQVQTLDLHSPEDLQLGLKLFIHQMHAVCVDEEILKMLVAKLHARSLEDRVFGMKAAAALGAASFFEVNGVKLRTLLLSAVQKDFDERSQLLTSNNSKFLNSVSFLGEIFHQVRLPGGAPILVLSSAVLMYQEMLLGGDEHEMQIFSYLLALNGQKLLESKPKELSQLMQRVRTMLISRNQSGQSRCWLLLALDLAANKFKHLLPDLQEYYEVHLGPTAVSELLRSDVELTVDTTTPPPTSPPVSELGLKSPVSQAGGRFSTLCLANLGNDLMPRPQRSVSLEAAQTPLPPEGNGSMPSRRDTNRVGWKEPIHGANSPTNDGDYQPLRQPKGASESISRRWQEGEKLDSDKEVWGLIEPKRSSVGWGHDDRFEKEYEKPEPRDPNRPRRKSTGVEKNWREEKTGQFEDKTPSLDVWHDRRKDIENKTNRVKPVLPTASSGGGDTWD